MSAEGGRERINERVRLLEVGLVGEGREKRIVRELRLEVGRPPAAVGDSAVRGNKGAGILAGSDDDALADWRRGFKSSDETWTIAEVEKDKFAGGKETEKCRFRNTTTTTSQREPKSARIHRKRAASWGPMVLLRRSKFDPQQYINNEWL
jgi:hypothetical protein